MIRFSRQSRSIADSKPRASGDDPKGDSVTVAGEL